MKLQSQHFNSKVRFSISLCGRDSSTYEFLQQLDYKVHAIEDPYPWLDLLLSCFLAVSDT